MPKIGVFGGDIFPKRPNLKQLDWNLPPPRPPVLEDISEVEVSNMSAKSRRFSLLFQIIWSNSQKCRLGRNLWDFTRNLNEFCRYFKDFGQNVKDFCPNPIYFSLNLIDIGPNLIYNSFKSKSHYSRNIIDFGWNLILRYKSKRFWSKSLRVGSKYHRFCLKSPKIWSK